MFPGPEDNRAVTENDGAEENRPPPIARWTICHFGQSNPSGPGQGNVAALLRRVANSIEGLGNIIVEDITFRSEPTGDERDLQMTVYYYDPNDPGVNADEPPD
jgi:hypothetical protein